MGWRREDKMENQREKDMDATGGQMRKKPERARAEEEEEMRRIRWGGGQEALSLSASRMGRKKSDERESKRRRRRGGRSKKKKKLERLWVCVRAKWGLYKWKQMPGIMNLSGRRWGWRWWSTWLPGWLSFTPLLLPLKLPSPVLGGREGERGRNRTGYKEKRDGENIHRVREIRGQEGGLLSEWLVALFK